MSLRSHTGKNGLIEESEQTTVQRALFNNSMSPNGQRGNLSAIFPKSPIHMNDGQRLNEFVAGGQDRANYVSTGDPYEDFKAYSIKDVAGGFGFENGDPVSMTYQSNSAPTFSINGTALVEQSNITVPDLYDADNDNSLIGHANLNTGRGFSTALHKSDNTTQVERNKKIPGSPVDASQNRLDNISQYFNAAGNRTQP